MTDLRMLDLWSGPDGCGTPMGCLATTFAFEPAFFEEDCVTRFLSLPSVASEGDATTTEVAGFEAEERQRDVQVTVLVDRSNSADKRSLHWDMLPVSVRGGCFHPKISLLVWENHTRIIVSSANLTSAGYRKNVEIGFAIDIDNKVSSAPLDVVTGVLDELRFYVTDLLPPEHGQARQRALDVLTYVDKVVEESTNQPSAAALRIAPAPSRPTGPGPLDTWSAVWAGAKPLRATVLAPFWDDAGDMPMLEQVRSLLTGVPKSERELTAVTAVNSFSGEFDAPPATLEIADSVRLFKDYDKEGRTLHAKAMVLEGRNTVAALVGSSNATAAAFGIATRGGNYEFNLWIAADSNTKAARSLRGLIPGGVVVDADKFVNRSDTPDDAGDTVAFLPLFYAVCMLDIASSQVILHLTLDSADAPTDWSIRLPDDSLLLTRAQWSDHGTPSELRLPLPATEELPNCVVVEWSDGENHWKSAWPVNTVDRKLLPPGAGPNITVSMLLAALASGRPLSAALEHARRNSQQNQTVGPELDPHKRVDDSSFLLRRARDDSAALHGLQAYLCRPARNAEAVACRFSGRLGPSHLARELVAESENKTRPVDSALFMVAELAMTIAYADWSQTNVEPKRLKPVLLAEINALRAIWQSAEHRPGSSLYDYINNAFQEASRCIGN